ncbi:alpha/beta hydrolase family protein [Bryobacter aggregatus]|uniref:alpha/beta hydrolase family protein n=1 Tax=Bryobacter aggregatus TaxID=360054 RepID=UPI0004E123B8|nr:acetylxylan esterase [Bryobacter aggregatus]
MPCLLIFLLCAPVLLAQSSEAYALQFQNWLTVQAEKQWTARDRAIANLTTKAAIQARSKEVRETALELIGGLPAVKTPLQAQITGAFAREGYRVEKIRFESQPGFVVTANLYLPTNSPGPHPAVLGVAGHSDTGKAYPTYQTAYIAFAKRGIAVLAYDPPGQGERLEFLDPATGKSRAGVGVGEHLMAGVPALLTGQTLARHFIWDGIRAVDYLLTRPEIDPKRIAVAGNSGGGTQAAYLSAFEPRLATAISSCYMTRWRELWVGPGPQDAEQIWPGFLARGLDFGDFALAQAPRPYLMTIATRDYFPAAGAHATFREMQRLFDILGGGDKLGLFEYDDTHGWSRPRREAAANWLDNLFLDQKAARPEPEIVPEPENALWVTQNGQLAESETVQSLTKKQAKLLADQRPKLTHTALETAIGWRGVTGSKSKLLRTEQKGSYRIEHLELLVEGEVAIPAHDYLPQAPTATWVVAGWSDTEIENLVGQGTRVLALSPRGSGAGYRKAGASGYNQSYQTAARAWLIGRNLLEMQAADFLSALLYLERSGSRRAKLAASGNLAAAATVAFALEPKFQELVTRSPFHSYQELIAAPTHEGIENTIVPGALKTFDLPDVRQLAQPRPVTDR